MKRNQRRAYNPDGTMIMPMDLAKLRENGGAVSLWRPVTLASTKRR